MRNFVNIDEYFMLEEYQNFKNSWTNFGRKYEKSNQKPEQCSKNSLTKILHSS